MDDRLYYSFLTLLLTFQTRFSDIMENRSGRLTTDVNVLEYLLERPLQSTEYYQDLNEDVNELEYLQPPPQSDSDQDLEELTEIEKQSLALEQDLRRAMIEISSSPRLSRLRRYLRRLQQKLGNLQAQLRAAIETLSKSGQQHQRRIIFSKLSMLEHQKQLEDQVRRGKLSRSCPNIPSELYDSNLDLIKWMSRNTSLDFKEDEDIRKMLDKDRVCLDMLCNRFMKKERKTSALHNLSFPMDRHHQGPMRDTDHPHWNQTHSRSQHSTGPIRDTDRPHWNQIRLRIEERFRDDNGIRRSSAPEQLDPESDSPRDVSSLIAQHNNAIRTATNQTRPSQSDSGIRRSASSAQQEHDSNSHRVKKAKQEKVPTTEVKHVVQSSGSPSFSEANISTAIYKTMTAICATIFMAIYF